MAPLTLLLAFPSPSAAPAPPSGRLVLPLRDLARLSKHVAAVHWWVGVAITSATCAPTGRLDRLVQEGLAGEDAAGRAQKLGHKRLPPAPRRSQLNNFKASLPKPHEGGQAIAKGRVRTSEQAYAYTL
ncbi:hypothetical protein GGTG_13830 [Gaeumannomyces tritici R3-111a-1]|uniref:Uncharacterized protein n=1 Tax=Gaeumannomyces tritici (strain R3-111a-1) TaxID=644352 RepID=J3PJY8_GAET3|nr:hypothetical protein GGTG_13830 [Gaeumannomyces tritici R3-111a-1]EJT68596.1 hypothetical protein GGTG_13830 [Gaeumannomyces tritici R3-111a-1]